MPKKILPPQATPSLVAERLRTWGRCIRTQRVAQGLPAKDLCTRIGISDATLRRMEGGDPGASASTYLAALLVLGVLDVAAPMLAPVYWAADAHARARNTSTGEADDYF